MSNYFAIHVPVWERLFQQLGWPGDEPRVVVEVGSFEGSSALWFAEKLLTRPESRLYCIDPWEDADDRLERFERRIAPYAAQVEILRSYSREALVELNHRGVQADVVYIDGSHRAPDVLSDLVLAFGIARIGGLIVCDDYHWKDPRLDGDSILGRPKVAIDAFSNIFADKIGWVTNVPNIQAMLIKRSD